jgi:hypothetical protein
LCFGAVGGTDCWVGLWMLVWFLLFEEIVCGCVCLVIIESGGKVEGNMWFCFVAVVVFWLFLGVLGFVFCLGCFWGDFWLLGLVLAVSKIFPDF